MTKEMEHEPRQQPEKEWPFSYLIPNTPYILHWDPGTSGLMPDISTFHYWEDDLNAGPDYPPRLTISYVGGAYLDVCPYLDAYVDASGGEFVYGGGDCMLANLSDETNFSWLAEYVRHENEQYNRHKKTEEPKETTDKETLEEVAKLRMEQLWEMPGESYGVYPPEAFTILYHSKN